MCGYHRRKRYRTIVYYVGGRKMKKTKRRQQAGKIGFVLCLTLLFLSGCTTKGASGGDIVSQIQESGVLRAAVCTKENPRFIQKEEGNTGIEAVLSEQIAQALGAAVTIVPVSSYEEGLAAIKKQEADLAFGAFDESRTDYLYSVPYDQESLYVLTQKGDYSDSLILFSDSSLTGKQRTLAMSSNISTRSDLNLPVSMSPVSDIKNGEIDGYVCTWSEGQMLLEKDLQIQNLQNSDPISYHIAVAAQNTRFMQGMNFIINQPPLEEGSTQQSSEK